MGAMGDESTPGGEVFISYSSTDKRWADATCAVLEKHRIRCWIAPRDITPGTEWGAAIIGGLDASKIMVLIFSTHANQSAQVRREVERAIGKGLIVLPFRIEDVSPAGAMEYALSNTHWLDAFTPPVERQLEFLATSVKTLLGKDRIELSVSPAASASPPAPARPYRRPMIAAGLACIMLIIVAGLFAMFRDRTPAPAPRERSPDPLRGNTVSPKVEAVAQSDQERIQGRWRAIEVTSSTPKKKALGSPQEWEFQGKRLTMHTSTNRGGDVELKGSFSLSGGVERKLFDFSGTRADATPFEMLGIYEFEGDFLKVCYWIRLDPNDAEFKRPDSFAVEPGSRRMFLKFERVADR
jgi:uncharacterized protein (TIGR03067 family)